MTLDDLFERSIPEPNSGCMIWLGSTTFYGYGTVRVCGSIARTHRLVYEITHGVVLNSSDFVCHRCDVTPCINPDHLFLSDNMGNQIDCVNKKRDNPVHGERNGFSTISDADVTEIKRLLVETDMRQWEIAVMFGISQPHVSAIKTGRLRAK